MKIEANGLSRTVVQYAISGLDFTPDPVWLDQDGTFFASIAGWFVVIRDGWSLLSTFLPKRKTKFSNQRSANLAKSLAHKPTGPVAFVHANLFDSETATVRPGSTVVVNGNKIVSVGADGKVNVPAGAQVIDASHKTLMPGLWDMHVHLFANDGILNWLRASRPCATWPTTSINSWRCSTALRMDRKSALAS